MNADELVLQLRTDGLRITKVRKTVIGLLHNTSAPMAVSEILRHLHVNKTTIYREINALRNRKYISEVDLGDGKKRYELADGSHHHHLVCVKCKSITDIVVEEDFTEIQKSLEIKNKFKVLKHHLEFFGTCRGCTT